MPRPGMFHVDVRKPGSAKLRRPARDMTILVRSSFWVQDEEADLERSLTPSRACLVVCYDVIRRTCHWPILWRSAARRKLGLLKRSLMVRLSARIDRAVKFAWIWRRERKIKGNPRDGVSSIY